MGKLAGIILLLVVTMVACEDPFELRSIDSRSFLVVEGFLSNTATNHMVRLSRTTEVDDDSFLAVEGATVFIQEENGSRISFFEGEPGQYESTPNTRGTIGNTYILNIQTPDGENYQSDPVVLRRTPPITDISLSFLDAQLNDGLERSTFRISLDTQDPANQTNFYRWEWEETFEILQPLESRFQWLEENNVIDRFEPNHRCWASDSSKSILIGSTEGLSQDVINDEFIHSFIASSAAMRVRYSILVRQMSLSRESYQFWSQLKTFNESPGGLFDRQPAPVTGNIFALDSDEQVLGYFDAAEVQEVRNFYTPRDFVAAGFLPSIPSLACPQDTVPITQIGDFLTPLSLSANPFEIINIFGGSYIVAPRGCTDCSNQGTIIQPDFW